jgi:hypothetical protein
VITPRIEPANLGAKAFTQGSASRADTQRIRGDKLVLGTISVLRTLIVELDKVGAIKVQSLLAAIDGTVTTHREHGDPNQLADAIGLIRGHISESVAVTNTGEHQPAIGKGGIASTST